MKKEFPERSDNEKELAYSNELLKYIVEHTQSSVAVHDADMNYIYVSNRYYNDMHLADRNIIGRNHYEIFPHLPDHIKDAHRRALNGEVLGAEAEQMYWPDGSIDWANWQCRPWYKSDGAIGGIIIYIEVITARKKAEDELHKHQEDLVAAKEKAEESDRLKTAFLNNISHEIRTPMNAIIGFSALLTEPNLDNETKAAYSETIAQSSNQLLAIINDIVEVSNIEAGIVQISNSKVQLNGTLKRLEDLFSLKANEKGVILRRITPLPDGEDVVISDITKFTQIFSNLLGNALKFTRYGTVEFGYRTDGEELEFFVSDTGIGIPENQISRVFDRFYQIDHQLSRLNEGTGLGLSISKAYVEMLGGRIWAESEPEKGSVFFFTLPFKKPAYEEAAVSTAKGEKPLRGEYHILVAEDDGINGDLLKSYLDVPGLKITLVTNGHEAVRYCLSGAKIDLVLMDMKMPVLNGFEATRIIKKHLPEIPVIAQTAYALSDDRERALSAGCIDLITKPFLKESLLSKIREHLTA